jgi:hypothetical protein
MLLLVLLVFAVEKRRLWSRAVEMSTVAQSSLLLMLLLMLALMLALLLSVVSRSCGSGQASKRAAMVLTACKRYTREVQQHARSVRALALLWTVREPRAGSI